MRNHLYDDVSGREQGAGNDGTETEKRKVAWDKRNDLSDDTFGRPQGAKNGATETDQVFMMKKNNENTDANHVLEKDTNQRKINSQCKDEKEWDRELHSDKNKAARDMRNDSSDDVPGREHGAENCYNELGNTNAKQVLKKDMGQREIESQCKDEKRKDGDLHPERNNVSIYLWNDSSDDVPGREHGAENGSTEPESLLEKDTENTNAKQLLEDTYQREINSQCKDEKERDGELHQEKSKTARDMRNDSFDDVLGRKHGVENGYTEPESLMDKDTENTNAKELLKEDTSQREINSQCKDGELHQERSKTVRDLTNDSSDVLGRKHEVENGYTEPESLMDKDTENTNAKELLKEDTSQREINSQCKDGELHQERSKPVRDLRNDSSDDDLVREHGAENSFPMKKDTENTNAKQVLEKDVSQREINRQCKDEKKRDGELHPVMSKDVRDLRNDSSDDISGRKHKDENGYTEPESLMEKDTENTRDTLQKSKLEASAATHILDMHTSMSKICGQYEDKKKSDRESGSEMGETAVESRTDFTDDIFGSEQGAKNDFFDVRFRIKDNEINREHTIQVGICNTESEIEVHEYLRRKDGSVGENKWQDDGRESCDTSCKKANDKHISSIDDQRRIANFRHERPVDARNRRDKLPKEFGINNRYHTVRYSDEASSSNHTNNMHHKRYMMEDDLTKNQYKKSKQPDSDQRMKSACKSRMFSNQSEDYRDLRSQHKKQTLGDVEESAINSSKLHSYADRNRSENRHSKKVDSVVGNNLSKISPIPIITRSRSRNCLGCRSREEESAQREPLWHDKSCASAASTKDHGSTSRVDHSSASGVQKRDSKQGYSEKDDRSTSHILKVKSWCRLRQGNSTERESLSHEKSRPGVAPTADNCGTPRVGKKESQYRHSEKDDFSVCNNQSKNSSCSSVKYERGLKQGNSTRREPSSYKKFCSSAASTVDHCSTPGVGKRDPECQHLEKVDFSVCDNQSKKPSTSLVNKYQSGRRSKEGNSTSSSQAIDLKNRRARG